MTGPPSSLVRPGERFGSIWHGVIVPATRGSRRIALQNTKTISVIENLLETVQDGRQGFAEAADRLDDDDEQLASEMRQFSQQRLRMLHELRFLAAAEGAPIRNVYGSAARTLHRSFMAPRDGVAGNDPYAVLAAAEQAEDHAIAEYERALSEDVPALVKSTLKRQFDEVQAAHDRVRSLRHRTT